MTTPTPTPEDVAALVRAARALAPVLAVRPAGFSLRACPVCHCTTLPVRAADRHFDGCPADELAAALAPFTRGEERDDAAD